MVTYSDSDFEETETSSPPEGGAGRIYSDSDFEEKKDVELTMDDLNTNKVWVGAANKIYEHEAGKKFEAGDQGYDNIADWFKKRHANLGYEITNMDMTVADAETESFV